MQRGKTETVWKILRTFGFDNKLAIRDDCCIPDPPPKVPGMHKALGKTLVVTCNLEQRLEFGKPIKDYLEDIFFAYSTNDKMSKYVLEQQRV